MLFASKVYQTELKRLGESVVSNFFGEQMLLVS